MRRFLSFGFIFLLCVLTLLWGIVPVFPSSSGQPSFRLTQEEEAYLETLKARPIVLAYSYDLVYASQDGIPRGLLEPLLEILREEFGLEAELRKLDWEEAFIHIQEGRVDFYGPIAISEARKQTYVTVAPFYRSYSKLVSREDDPINSMLGLYNRRLGLLNGSVIAKSTQTYLGPNGTPVYFPTMEAMIQGLQDEVIDAFVTVDHAEFEIFAAQNIRYEFTIENVYVDQGLISGREELLPLAALLDRYVEAHPQIGEQMSQLRQQILLEEARSRLADDIALLQDAYDEALLYADPYLYPLCYLEKGSVKGMQLEINQVFEALTGIPVRFGTAEEFPRGWESALEQLKTGDCLGYVGGYYDVDTWSDPAIAYSPMIWLDNLHTYSYNDPRTTLMGKTVGTVPLSAGYIGWNNMIGNSPTLFPSYKELLDAFDLGQLDAVLMGETVFDYLYSVRNDYSLHEVTDISAEATMHILYGAQTPSFNRVFNEAIGLYQIINPKSIAGWKAHSNEYKSDYMRMRHAQQIWSFLLVGLLLAVLILTLFLLRRHRRFNTQLEALVSQRTAELEVQTQAAQVASQAKGEFLSRMSHEIRTPLNAIVGMAQVARQFPDQPDKALQSIGEIVTASHHLMDIVNDILDMSKIEADKISLLLEPFFLSEAVEEVAEIIARQCEERGRIFRSNHLELPPLGVVGDRLRLKQVLINLLGNAVKFSRPNGTVELRLELVSEADERLELLFLVEDDGIGMSAEEVELLFLPFEQSRQSAQSQGGTGLGLAISQSLVKLMGSEILVESQPGEGSRFYFTLEMEQANPVFSSQGGEEETPQLWGRRILLVDDVAINRVILMELLSDTGVSFEEAENGQQAVDLFARSAPGYYDLILMDVQMPVKNGHQATREIRALGHPDAVRIPILAMTANAYQEDVAEALSSGMNGHIAKPVDIRVVNRTLSRLLPPLPRE